MDTGLSDAGSSLLAAVISCYVAWSVWRSASHCPRRLVGGTRKLNHTGLVAKCGCPESITGATCFMGAYLENLAPIHLCLGRAQSMHEEVPCCLYPSPWKAYKSHSRNIQTTLLCFSSVFILMTLKYQQYQPNSLGHEVETAVM